MVTPGVVCKSNRNVQLFNIKIIVLSLNNLIFAGIFVEQFKLRESK